MRAFASQNSKPKTAPQKSVKTKPVASQPAHPLWLQRKACNCGGSFPRCQSEARLQPKLNISEPGDRYEQEADRIADQVMRMPEPSLQRQIEPEAEEGMVQRKEISQPTPLNSNQSPSDAPSIVHEALHSPGKPLDTKTRTFMESRFGHDFSQVRIHIDARASKSARSINARAYTVGQNIVFGASQYAPQTQAGLTVLAHELTHTIQQSGSLNNRISSTQIGIQRQCTPPSNSELEEPAGGCAIKNHLPPDMAGVMAEDQIAEDQRVDMLRHPKLPRATKGASNKFNEFVGTLCPDKDRAFGEPDLYKYESPYFYMAEIKSVSSWATAEAQYRHYARRFSELVSRWWGQGLCPIIDEPGPFFEPFREDQLFNQDYLNNDLNNEEFILPAPATNQHVPNQAVDAGPFPRPIIPSIPSTKNLFFCNFEHGGVIYWCENKKEEKDEAEEEEQKPSDADFMDYLDYLGSCVLQALAGEFIQDPSWCGILLGGAAELIPYYDQVADVRDIVAHLYWMLYVGQYDSPERWLGLTFSLIGLIPEIGTIIQKTGKLGKKALKESLEALENNALGQYLLDALEGVDVNLLRKTIESSWETGKTKGIEKMNEILNLIRTITINLQKLEENLSSVVFLSLDAFRIQLNKILERLDNLSLDVTPKLTESFDAAQEQFWMVIDVLTKRKEQEILPVTPSPVNPPTQPRVPNPPRRTSPVPQVQ